eukprot:3056347-Prorocentrum_lima.AAC.1
MSEAKVSHQSASIEEGGGTEMTPTSPRRGEGGRRAEAAPTWRGDAEKERPPENPPEPEGQKERGGQDLPPDG